MADITTEFEAGGHKLAIAKPTAQQNEDASMEYNRVFSKALNNGALLREKLEVHMRQQNLWDDVKEKEYSDIIARLNNAEMRLNKGGIKLSKARQIAIEMRNTRGELQQLIAEKNSMDVNTAQGQAEQARFNQLLVSCLVYSDSEKPFYQSVDDYLEKQSAGNDKVGFVGAEKFGNVYFGLDSDYEKGLPENQFLKKWQFIDQKLHLVNKEGHPIDEEGRLVDDAGRFIDDKGSFVDRDGNPLTEDGEYDFKSEPFLDDDGKELDDPDEVAKSDSEEDKPKKRGRPSKKKTEVETEEEEPQPA